MAARPDPAARPVDAALTATGEVMVYTLPFCGACARARALLERRAIVYHEISGASVPGFRGQLAARTGRATVPQVVIRGVALGGADDLARLDRLGLLLPLAAGDPFPIVADRVRRSPRSLGRWLMGTLRGRRDRATTETVRGSLDATGRIEERSVRPRASPGAGDRCDELQPDGGRR